MKDTPSLDRNSMCHHCTYSTGPNIIRSLLEFNLVFIVTNLFLLNELLITILSV